MPAFGDIAQDIDLARAGGSLDARGLRYCGRLDLKDASSDLMHTGCRAAALAPLLQRAGRFAADCGRHRLIEEPAYQSSKGLLSKMGKCPIGTDDAAIMIYNGYGVLHGIERRLPVALGPLDRFEQPRRVQGMVGIWRSAGARGVGQQPPVLESNSGMFGKDI